MYHELNKDLQMKESLYLVLSLTKGDPPKLCPDVDAARDEARRLCQIPENHGHVFFTLRAVESVAYRSDPCVSKVYCKKG